MTKHDKRIAVQGSRAVGQVVRPATGVEANNCDEVGHRHTKKAKSDVAASKASYNAAVSRLAR